MLSSQTSFLERFTASPYGHECRPHGAPDQTARLKHHLASQPGPSEGSARGPFFRRHRKNFFSGPNHDNAAARAFARMPLIVVGAWDAMSLARRSTATAA